MNVFKREDKPLIHIITAAERRCFWIRKEGTQLATLMRNLLRMYIVFPRRPFPLAMFLIASGVHYVAVSVLMLCRHSTAAAPPDVSATLIPPYMYVQ